MNANVNLDQLLERTRLPPPPAIDPAARITKRVRVGIGRGEAFSFYYEDNLIQLADAGAELVVFSPLRDELPEDLDGLYLGGGYPELHAAQLAANASMLAGVRQLAARGRPSRPPAGVALNPVHEAATSRPGEPFRSGLAEGMGRRGRKSDLEQCYATDAIDARVWPSM